MRTALLAGIGCLLLVVFSQAAPGARLHVAGTISGTATWTPTSSSQGTLTMSWSGAPSSISDGFILVNDSGATTSTKYGDMLVSPCPRNTCNTASGAGFDFFSLVGQQGGSGTDSETMDVPQTGHWYVQFDAEQPSTGSQCPGVCLSNIIDVAAAGLAPKPATVGSSSGSSVGSSSNKAVQVAEGWATLTRNGTATKCTETNCAVGGFAVGDEIATGANSYILIKSKGYGTVRVGPNTKFTISEHFADLEGGSIEYQQVRHQVLEHLYVAPLPALNYVGGKPKAYTAGVQAVQGANLDAFISTTSASKTVRGVASAGAAKTVTVDVISGAAKVSDQHGHTHVIEAGHEQELVGGTLKQPTTYTQASCDLTGQGYGAFCGNGPAASNPSLPNGTIAPFKSTYYYCCWSGAQLKVAWASGGTALNMSWTNPGPRSPVSIIYIGSTIVQPGVLWPGDLWRHYWDPLDPSVASFTLTSTDFAQDPWPTTWARLHQGGLYFQVSWECHIGYNDRQAGVTCDGPVTGQTDVDLWSTLVKVPAG